MKFYGAHVKSHLKPQLTIHGVHYTVFFHNSDNKKYLATGGRNAYLCVCTFRNLKLLVSGVQICGTWYSLFRRFQEFKTGFKSKTTARK